jgi:hypothetical protein
MGHNFGEPCSTFESDVGQVIISSLNKFVHSLVIEIASS